MGRRSSGRRRLEGEVQRVASPNGSTGLITILHLASSHPVHAASTTQLPSSSALGCKNRTLAWPPPATRYRENFQVAVVFFRFDHYYRLAGRLCVLLIDSNTDVRIVFSQLQVRMWERSAWISFPRSWHLRSTKLRIARWKSRKLRRCWPHWQISSRPRTGGCRSWRRRTTRWSSPSHGSRRLRACPHALYIDVRFHLSFSF